MKKLVKGLTGILLLFTSGCMVYQANEDVNKIRYHVRSIKKIIGADPNDAFRVFEPKRMGEPFRVYIIKENGTLESSKYIDSDGDGIYEGKVPRPPEITIPDKLKMRILPPPKKQIPIPYIPEKKKVYI